MRRNLANQKFSWLPPMPMAAPKDYELGNYKIEEVATLIAPKYLNRRANLKRAWVRICTHLPEATMSGETYDILELSTAHGAKLELFRALGHNVEGTDFAFPDEIFRPYRNLLDNEKGSFNKSHAHPIRPRIPGWGYQPIIESLGLEVSLFNAGETPYPYEDKSFDYIVCYQAIDAYGPISEWPRIIAEMCRIARKGIVIGFNPPGRLYGEEGGWDASRKGWEMLRSYNENGFHNVLFELEETKRAFHPTACKLVAK